MAEVQAIESKYEAIPIDPNNPFGVTEDQSVPIPEEFSRPLPIAAEEYGDLSELEDVTYEQLASDTDYMDMLGDYMTDRLGEGGQQRRNESNEDYVKRFVNHARRFEFNSIKLGDQLSWVRNADTQQRMEFGYLYTQLDKLPSFYQEGGAGWAPAMRDIGGALLMDPLTYIGFGAGAIGTRVATRAVIEALKGTAKRGATAAATQQVASGAARRATVEGGKRAAINAAATNARNLTIAGVGGEIALGVHQERKLQEVELLSGLRDKISYKELAPAAILGGVLGVGGAALGGGLTRRGIRRLSQNRARNQIRAQRQHRVGLNNRQRLAEELAVEAARKDTTDTATGIFNYDSGRAVLDRLGTIDETKYTQAQFNLEVMRRVGKVITETVQELADNGQLSRIVDEDTKASEVVGKVITDRLEAVKARKADAVAEETAGLFEQKDIVAALDVDREGFDEALEAAITRSGLTVKQFADAMGASASDAGRMLNVFSPVGKIMKKLGKLDKDLEKALLEATPAEEAAGFMSRAMDFIKKLDRERRALMVTQIATTVRNVATGGTRVLLQTGADLMESALYQVGRGEAAATIGNSGVGNASFRDILSDGFGKLRHLAAVSNTRTISDDLLRHNPRLASRIDRTLQEVDADDVTDLTRITRVANTLNVAQDQFFRRAIFVDSVEKKLKRAGIITNNPTRSGQYKSMEEFIESGKTLPGSVLADSIEEALEFTFSRMPKEGEFGHRFIKFTEAVGPGPAALTPFLGGITIPNTVMLPFSRFMVNALKFQHDFSPIGAIGAMQKRHTAGKLRDAAKALKRAGKLDEASEEAKKAVALAAKARGEFAKATMGTAAFAAAVYHRYNNQDLKFYEYRREDGSTGDLRPYFPLTPYLAVAELFVKGTQALADPAKGFKHMDLPAIIAGITGVQARTGASSYVLERASSLADSILKGEDGPREEKFKEYLGKVAAEYAGSYITPARIVRDIVAAYDTQEATLRDASQAEGRFDKAFIQTIARNVPYASQYLPALQSPTRSGDIYRERSLVGQLGLPRIETARNPVEEEMVRLNIPGYSVRARTGDATADMYVNTRLGEYAEEHVSRLVTSQRYQEMTDVQKRAALRNELTRMRGISRDLGEYDLRQERSGAESYNTPFDKAKFNNLNSNELSLVQEYYKTEYGKTVQEMAEEDPYVNHYGRAAELGRSLNRGL